MFTTSERNFLLKVLKTLRIGGTIDEVKKTMEVMDSIQRKLEASPAADEATPEEKPAEKRTRK